MTQLSIQVHGEMVRKGLQNLADEIPKVARLPIYRAVVRIRTGMRKQGAKPTYPIPWDSVRQMKAFYASKGFRGGVPHVRGSRYVDGWQIENIGDQGYRVINNMPGTQYVSGNAYGQFQSRIHRGRWPVFRDVADKEIKGLPEEIAKEIKTVARREGLSA